MKEDDISAYSAPSPTGNREATSNMSKDEQCEGPTIYQIKVKGVLDTQWSDWFSGMAISMENDEPSITTLTGAVLDQAALRGILYRIWNLNLTLISVIPVGKDDLDDDN